MAGNKCPDCGFTEIYRIDYKHQRVYVTHREEFNDQFFLYFNSALLPGTPSVNGCRCREVTYNIARDELLDTLSTEEISVLRPSSS